MSRKHALLILLLVIGAFITPIPHVRAAEPWLEGFEHRKYHNMTAAAGSGTDYQIKIVIHYGTGSDSGENVYLESLSQSDFDDVRFTDNDKQTELDYWIEEVNSGINCTVWVEVADDLTSNQQIYLYYGNATTTTTSNGTATFPVWHDFESGISGWTAVGGALSQSGDTAKHGSYSMKVDDDGAAGEGGYTTFSGLTTYRMKFWYNVSQTDKNLNWYLMDVGGDEGPTFRFANDASIEYYPGAWTDIVDPYVANVWYEFEILANVTSDKMDAYVDDYLEIDDGDFWKNTGDTTKYSILGGAADLLTVYIDTLFCAKYVESEPAHGAWGSRETQCVYEVDISITGMYFENGTQADGATATVTFESGSITDYPLDGNTTRILTNDTVVRITWPVSFGADSGTRIIEAQTKNESHTLFVPETTFGIYTFEIRDYTARLGAGTAYLEAYRVINSVSRLIEKRTVIAADPYVSMILVTGKVYRLTVRFADNSTYDFGLKTMTDDVTMSLPVLTMFFSQKAQSTYTYVTVEATRPTHTKILVNYDDTRESTNWANVTVEHLNGTKVTSANYSTDSFSYSYLSAVHNLTYKVRIEFDHGDFGLLPDVVFFLEGNVTYSDTPDIGAAGSVGVMETTDLLGMIIIASVVGAGTYRNSEAVLLAAALIAAMFSAIGFVSFDVTLIEVVIGIVLIYNLVRSSN